jgi:hypothetical protein
MKNRDMALTCGNKMQTPYYPALEGSLGAVFVEARSLLRTVAEAVTRSIGEDTAQT